MEGDRAKARAEVGRLVKTPLQVRECAGLCGVVAPLFSKY